MSDSQSHTLFVEGAISPSTIREQIMKDSDDRRAGGTEMFLGRVRNDQVDGNVVKAIEYTAYREMALKKYKEIKEKVFDHNEIRSLQVYHSLGMVQAGEISLFVYITAEHQSDAISACDETVKLIKEKLPIWGKEIFSDKSYVWKESNSAKNSRTD